MVGADLGASLNSAKRSALAEVSRRFRGLIFERDPWPTSFSR